MVILQAAFVAIALSGTGQTVLMDFYSDSCGPCRQMNPIVQELEKTGYPVQRVNVTQKQNQSLVAQYRVGQIPCFVMVVDGKEVDRVVGGTSPYRLQQMCKKAASAKAPGNAPAMLAQNGQPTSQPFPPSAPLPASPFDDHASRPASLPPASAPAAMSGNPADAALLAASVRLRVEDPGGRSCGSGTIIDAGDGQALILTCGHIFRDSQGKGRITVDLFGSNGVQQVAGKLISYDSEAREMGLVAIRTPGPVAVARVAPPGYRLEHGAPVVSVGCNNGDLPTALHNQVIAVGQDPAAPYVKVTGQPVEGRSGGGLFSSEGYVIGVCFAADPADKVGFYSALGSIYSQLDRAKLSFVYKSPGGNTAGSAEAAAPAALAANSLPPVPTSMPGRTDLAALRSLALPRAASPAALPPNEQAALDEIHRRFKEGAEVVCIIRSRENPTAKSEVIMLDRASPDFLKQLSANARPQDRPYPTSLELPPQRKKLLEWPASQ